MANHHEMLLRLLKGENPGGIIWTADITYWISGQSDKKGSSALWRTEKGYFELCSELKIMPYYWYDKFWLGEPEYDGKVRVTTGRKGTLTVRTWETGGRKGRKSSRPDIGMGIGYAGCHTPRSRLRAW